MFSKNMVNFFCIAFFRRHLITMQCIFMSPKKKIHTAIKILGYWPYNVVLDSIYNIVLGSYHYKLFTETEGKLDFVIEHINYSPNIVIPDRKWLTGQWFLIWSILLSIYLLKIFWCIHAKVQYFKSILAKAEEPMIRCNSYFKISF